MELSTSQRKERDDEGNDDASLATSVSSMAYDDKLSEIKHQQMHEWSTRRVSNIARTGARLVGRSALSAAKESERHLLPEFWAKRRRERATRQALAQIEADERKRLHDREAAREAAREKWEQMQISRAEALRRIEDSAETVEQLHTAKRDHEATERQSRIDEFQLRYAQEEQRRIQLQKAEAEAREARLEAEERKRRTEALAYWTEKAGELRKEASELEKLRRGSNETETETNGPHGRRSKASANIEDGGVETGKGASSPEYPARSVFRSSYQVEDTRDVFGVGAVEAEQLPLFSQTHRTQGEEVRAAIMDKDMRIAKQENYIASIEKKVSDVGEQIQMHSSQKQNLEKEKDHVNAEIKDLLRRQPKPIRVQLDPPDAEKIEMHRKKERSAQIQSQVRQIDGIIANLNQRITEHNSELVSAKNRHNPEERRGGTNAGDSEPHDLPMVLGRRLGKAAFDPFTAEPSATHDIIMQQSRAAILHADVENALDTHRSVRAEDIAKANKTYEHDKSALDYLESKASQAAQRLETGTKQRQRQGINDAVRRFWRAGGHLDKAAENQDVLVGAVSETSNSSKHVVSQFVKHVRLDEQLGDRKIANLLSELIAASDSSDEYWDSGVLLGSHHKVSGVGADGRRNESFGRMSMQSRMNNCAVGGAKCFKRYKREAFINQVQAEVSRLNASIQERQCRASEGRVTDGPKAAWEARLLASKGKYIQRKRGAFRDEISLATDLENCQIQVTDDDDFGHLRVKQCRISWTENGTVPLIEHCVQAAHADWTPCGEDFYLDLRGRCFFIVKRPEDVPTAPPALTSDLGNGQRMLRVPNFSRAVMRGQETVSSSLEKERWELAQMQDRFYDFEVTKGVYKITLRHHDMTQPRATPSGADDFRTLDLKRKAAFDDILDKISRIRGFKIRLRELDIKRSALIHEQSGVLKSLACREREMAAERIHLEGVERDFFEAAHRIEYAAMMRQSHANAEPQLAISEAERRKAFDALVEVREAASKAENDRIALSTRIKSICQQKLQVEALMPDLRERAELTRELANHCRQAMERAEDTVSTLQFRCRGQFVPTRFGPKRVQFFREKDSMLCVSLQFGNKQRGGGALLNAKMYVPLAECVERDKTATKMERDMMSQEDKAMRQHMSLEVAMSKKESIALALEERAIDAALKNEEVAEMEREITLRHEKSSLKKSIQDLRKSSINLQLKRRMSDALRLAERAEGANSESSMYDRRSILQRNMNQFMLRKKVAKQERLDFARDRAAAEHKLVIDADLAIERNKRVCLEVTTDLTLDVTKQLIHELCADALAMDVAAKEEATLERQLSFPQYPFLTHDSYAEFCRIWSLRKARLREEVEGSKFADYAVGVRTIEQVKQDLLRRKQEEVDEARRMTEQRQMSLEDSACQQLYHYELNTALKERRNMISEEHQMKLFLKQERMEQERKKRAQYVFSQEVSAKSLRRTELKRGAAERQRIQKEVALMKIEDDLSEKAREEYRKQEQLRMLQMELDGELQSMGGGSTEHYGTSSGDAACFPSVRDEAEYKDAVLAYAAAELDWMERQEESNTCEEELRRNERELKALGKEFKQCFRQEIAVTIRQRATQIQLKMCTETNAMAIEGRRGRCKHLAEIEKELMQAELKKKWMDTKELTSFHQRWPTLQLRDKLKGVYFERLACFIVSKTQVEIVEKRSQELRAAIAKTESEIHAKKCAMESLRNKSRRNQLLAQYRSVLGKALFAKERRKTLARAWKGWRFFLSWHRGHREAFELKYVQLLNAQKVNKIGSYIEQRKENIPSLLNGSES